MEPFYVKFTFTDNARYELAEQAFARIQTCKINDEWPESVDEWKDHFDDQALTHFWWPTPDELKAWADLAFTIPVDERWKDPRLDHPWDFMSMMEAFQNGEYELVGLEPAGEGVGMITFEPYAHPYGGSGCMKAFVEAFEMQVIDTQE